MKLHWFCRLLVVAALPLALAACGGDDPGGGGGGGGSGGEDGTGGTGGGEPASPYNLVVDVNRDGVVTPGEDDLGEDDWDATRGAIFLANLDDDDDDGRVDSLDGKVNGPDDLLDLTPILVAPVEVPEGAVGRVFVDEASLESVRLFLAEGPADDYRSYKSVSNGRELDAAALAAGVTFALEGKTPVTSLEEGEWSGFVDVRLEVRDAGGALLGEDSVRLRVAPFLFQFNTAPTLAVFHTDVGRWSEPLLDGLVPALARRGLAPTALTTPGGTDQWTQDFFDIAYTSKPGPDGQPVGMHVAIRSPQPDRPAGKVATTYFLGPDFGAFYIHEPGGTDPYTHGYSMNSFGNWEVVPPHVTDTEEYPLGRNVFGAGRTRASRPDPVYEGFVRAQAVQPAIEMDTTWLIVGHVDEYVQWVHDPGPKGFRTIVADAAESREMLLELQAAGHGDEPMFVDKYVYDYETEREYPAQATIDQVLANADLMAASEYSQAVIDREFEKLAATTGLEPEDVTTMPGLYEEMWGQHISYQPGTVNLLHVDGVLVVADPFGPVIDGVDPFKKDLEQKFEPLGIEVFFADDWDLYHANMGEVHCGTNVVREMSHLRWWESGR